MPARLWTDWSGSEPITDRNFADLFASAQGTTSLRNPSWKEALKL